MVPLSYLPQSLSLYLLVFGFASVTRFNYDCLYDPDFETNHQSLVGSLVGIHLHTILHLSPESAGCHYTHSIYYSRCPLVPSPSLTDFCGPRASIQSCCEFVVTIALYTLGAGGI